LRFGCSYWTGRRWFLLRQFGNGQFHRALNRNASNAFVFVDPTIRSQSFGGVFARGFQVFHAFFRPRFFVIGSARRRADHGEHDYTEKRKEKHDPKPRGEWSARMGNLTKRIGVSHVS
jgi:hypothetical protein